MTAPETGIGEYIADHYGYCRAPVCLCLKTGWIGRLCKHWVPVKSRSWEALREELKHVRSVGAASQPLL